MLSAKPGSSRGLPSLKRTARTWVTGFALGGTYLMAGAMLVLSFELKSTPQLLGTGILKKKNGATKSDTHYAPCMVYLPTLIPSQSTKCVGWWLPFPWIRHGIAINFPSERSVLQFSSICESIRRREIDPEKGVCVFFSRFGLEKNIEKHVGLSCRIPTLPSIQLDVYTVYSTYKSIWY